MNNRQKQIFLHFILLFLLPWLIIVGNSGVHISNKAKTSSVLLLPAHVIFTPSIAIILNNESHHYFTSPQASS
jgi:hypothetical protein